MSQEQQARRLPEEEEEETRQEPITYVDVFPVSGDLAQKPIAPGEAAMMQTAETTVFGQVQPGGSAAVNEREGLDDRCDVTAAPGGGGKDVPVTATDYPGGRVVTESVGSQTAQVQQTKTTSAGGTTTTTGSTTLQSKITIGEALEAAARVCGDKPVDRSDAAAIQEAEAIATGSDVMTPGGVAVTAMSAASFNAGQDRDEDKIKLTYVLSDATAKLLTDRVATREDADKVASAEQRNSPNLTVHPAGVAASVATAVRLNEGA